VPPWLKPLFLHDTGVDGVYNGTSRHLDVMPACRLNVCYRMVFQIRCPKPVQFEFATTVSRFRAAAVGEDRLSPSILMRWSNAPSPRSRAKKNRELSEILPMLASIFCADFSVGRQARTV
jgi:hypothetical protein